MSSKTDRRGLRRLWEEKVRRRKSERPPSPEAGIHIARKVYIPFDEQRNHGQERRADIIFGPDMYDPRTKNGARPLRDAIAAGSSDVKPSDLDRTVGEVLGNVTLKEATPIALKNARSVRLDPDAR